jgi:hypothetical protein
MNLEQLKQAMEAAAAKAAEQPEDEALKAAAEEAKQAYEAAKAEQDAGGDGEVDESGLDAKTKAYIAKLRKESAKHRIDAKDTKAKLKAEEERKKAILKAAGIESEDDEPAEEKLKKSLTQSNQLQFRNAILETAVAHGIGSDKLKYFQFLMSDAVESLKEGEELSDEKLAEVVAEAKKQGGSGKGNTTVGGGKDGKGSGTPNPEGGSNEVTLDQFIRMTITEKSGLFLKNRARYDELVKEAKQKKKLV